MIPKHEYSTLLSLGLSPSTIEKLLAGGSGNSAGGPKVYRALINQNGTNHPVVTVLENTIGNIVWTRDGVGFYQGTLAGAFPAGKTHFTVGSSGWGSTLTVYGGSGDSVYIQTQDLNGETMVPMVSADGRFDNTAIEIYVYP